MTIEVGDKVILIPDGRGGYLTQKAITPELGDKILLIPNKNGGYFLTKLFIPEIGDNVLVFNERSNIIAPISILISAPGTAFDIVVDENNVYVSNYLGSSIHKLTHNLSSIDSENIPQCFGMGISEDNIYVAGWAVSKVEIRAKSDFSLITTHTFNATDVYIDEPNDFAYISTLNYNPLGLRENYITKVNLSDFSIVCISDIQYTGAGLYFQAVGHGDYIYWAFRGGQSIKKLNKSDLSEVTTISTAPYYPLGIVTDGNFLYVTLGSNIAKYNCSDLSYISSKWSVQGTAFNNVWGIGLYNNHLYIGDIGLNIIYKIKKF